jgi:hypothetical protein
MINEDFKTIQEDHKFTLAANGYSLYINGTDYIDNYIAKTYVFNDKLDFMAAIASLEEIEVC